jgi:hypothetical protein
MSILSRSACPRAGSELVVLVLEEDVGCMISDLYLGTSRRTRPLTRGVAGHVAHPIRSILISEAFTTENTEHAETSGLPRIFNFSAASAVNNLKIVRDGDRPSQRLFEQLPQMLKHDVFFVGARAIGEKELLAQVQCLRLYCIGTKPIADRTQEFISVHLTFSRVPCVTNRSRVELIERYCFRVPLELRDRIGNQPVLREHDQVVSVHAIV